MKRRTFLQGTLTASAAGLAAGAGLLTPGAVMADGHGGGDMAAAFKLDNYAAAMEAIGAKDAAESGDIKIKAPEIAENGAVVPVTISTEMEGVTQIAMVVTENPTPLAAVFNMTEGAQAMASTRLKMGKTSDMVAVVTAGDKSFMAKQEIKVTIGGCGG
ncbi:MAG: Sulfur oxidation protein SoxY [uncultured Thiotrichaceae bacterium]|uniref:Sulfur oxidation protein SoxY n=1 Tax=uncultured Thiotrichaceae bacterium TaxID=298394 RepID=A0A6S6UE74_9GAMM|nr:MAG: Sulfur oxidation protein SoxY [uncultured Thiotrichaceae bacterium]